MNTQLSRIQAELRKAKAEQEALMRQVVEMERKAFLRKLRNNVAAK